MKIVLWKRLAWCARVLSVCALGGVLCSGPARGASFVDPTVVSVGSVIIGDEVFVAPFATLLAGNNKIFIGNETNVQDSVMLDATRSHVILGAQVIIAHGATVKGYARIGVGGICPTEESPCPSFVGFNAEIDRAHVQKDAMVGHLARVAPGLIIRSGLKVLPGKNVTTRAEASDPLLGKVAAMIPDDRTFMHDVVEVNKAFANGYAALSGSSSGGRQVGPPASVSGISAAPMTTFNEGATPRRGCTVLDTPPTCTEVTADPTFRNRIIGDVRLSNTTAQLDDVMGSKVSLRGDEGEPFKVGTITHMDSRLTFHALEETEIELGDNGRYGYHSLVHGGPNAFNSRTTETGDGFKLGAYSVFFNSCVLDNVEVGFKSAVISSDLCATPLAVPDCKIVNAGAIVGDVEWCY